MISQSIMKNIETIELEGYHEKAQKMSEIMKRSGGLDKPADLVEIYVNIQGPITILVSTSNTHMYVLCFPVIMQSYLRRL